MKLVLDCSVAISWCMQDEENAYAELLASLLISANYQLLVPDIWWLELANVLLVSERRQRNAPEDTQAAMVFLRRLPVLVKPTYDREVSNAILTLGRQHNLAAYDAAYLELALREKRLLATVDTRLMGVAKSLDILLEDPQL